MVSIFVNWLLVALTLVSVSPSEFGAARRATIKRIPSQVATGDIQAFSTSNQAGLDAPRLSAVNASSFNWWYFDAFSPDLDKSLVVVFFTTLGSAFPFVPTSEVVTQVEIYATFPTAPSPATSGDFVGSGAKFQGAPDLSTYSISVDSPANGISNTIPDAEGTVDFTIFGSRLKFSGAAYHDQNWGDAPFPTTVASWYWGHARLGPYALVWFSYLPRAGPERVSSYIAHDDGTVLAAGCTADAVRVRPTGQYPPTQRSGYPSGFRVDFRLADGRTLNVTVRAESLIADAGAVYGRWMGGVEGRLDGGRMITRGKALFEQYVMVA
ncbi:hypothetical protein MBM_07582 [Drepanopeziza brunnea f. sp. 'multigermtubi' MB_m1]|uniref:Hydroxyneurosporene synthase n=1 Tax=Marssonina brunnea f. sp. multigermtubi (strain MB_m1) TaxID=1072389 RepID=K1WPQ1_MARBU|nr:uncharacterized protein MBM_07582 [Drepanopeziza brunnea f. sp. 'multigermtubi' MB_m1]EKD14352.1 hypothetical protein MBM_07582 [Drepanopeziza brunnea f. sp. 'multigermtubi' MB_m1]